MITKYIKGDITETELKYIAHGVNCRNVMGSGVAKAIFTKWPDVKNNYHKYFERYGYLGEIHEAYSDSKVSIINCFTQDKFGNSGKKYVNYAAVVTCFEKLSRLIPKNEILAIPKIGCGLAGGDWNIVEQLINDTVGDELEIWVYEL